MNVSSQIQTAIEVAPLSFLGNWLDGALDNWRQRRVFLATDTTVGDLYASTVEAALGGGQRVIRWEIKPGEESKSLENVKQIYERLAVEGFPRDGFVVALGGGVVSDLAGFVAATWMRGVDWVVCPTTLEAQIDASIGGKTAINLPEGKNLVGSFQFPKLVLIDPSTLRTLPPGEFRAGLAESVKHAAIMSEAFFEWHEANVERILSQDEATISELIERNTGIKAEIVRRDPYERSGERALLNFGHTIGHAIETCCGFSLRHGECVGLGMLAAAKISELHGLIEGAAVERLRRLIGRFGLPTKVPEAVPIARLGEVMHRDKKKRGGKIGFVLLSGIGKAKSGVEVEEDTIEAAYREICA